MKTKRTRRVKETRATYETRQKRDGLEFLALNERRALAEYLARLRAEFGDEIERVILYGSKVRGDFDEESDIDLFLVVRALDPQIEDALTRLSVDMDLKYDLLLSDFIATHERYARMAKIQEPLYQNLQAEGVDLWTRTPASLLKSVSRRARTTSRGHARSLSRVAIAKPSAARTTRSLR